MAGWKWWNNLNFGQSTSSAKTVTESLGPIAAAVAADQGWINWEDTMVFALSTGVVRAKTREFALLAREQEVADAVFAGEMWAASDFHNNVLRFATIGEAIEWILLWTRPHAPRTPTGKSATLLNEHPIVKRYVPGYRPIDNGPIALNWDQITIEHLIIYWYLHASGMETESATIQALAHYVSGMCKMGNMTEQWRRSRMQQIQKDVKNYDFELSKRTSEAVWDFYGSAYGIIENKHAEFFLYMERCCKDKKLVRLSVTAQQAADQGCAVILFIQSAMLQCPDFNWSRFTNPRVPAEIQIAKELGIFEADLAALKVNPYMRFEGTTGHTPQMANLGYLAKSLLDKAKGETSVENYKGLDLGNLTISYRVWIDRVVRLYIEALAARAAETETEVQVLQDVPEGFIASHTMPTIRRPDMAPALQPLPVTPFAQYVLPQAPQGPAPGGPPRPPQ